MCGVLPAKPLYARIDMLRYALDGIAATGKLDLRTAAAMKVTAARLGEEVMNECMHIFGGSGYLVDETPLGKWWRDMKLARVGGGTDEVRTVDTVRLRNHKLCQHLGRLVRHDAAMEMIRVFDSDATA